MWFEFSPCLKSQIILSLTSKWLVFKVDLLVDVKVFFASSKPV